MRIRMNTLSVLAAVLAIIGALNWGAVGLFNFNLVRVLSRRSWLFERVVYGLVGLAGVWLAIGLGIPTALTKIGRKADGATVLPGKDSIVGQDFPHLQGNTLEGRRIRFPEDLRGRVALLVVGFSYESRWDVEDWVDAFRHRFEDRPGFTFYEIPVVDGLPRLAAPVIDQGMRRGTPSYMHSRVVTVYAPVEPIRNRLGAAHVADTWIYLLDSEGKVLFQVGGAFNEEQFENLVARASAAEAAARPRIERRAA